MESKDIEKKQLVRTIQALGIVVAFIAAAMTIYAADTQNINATVTVQNISVAVSDGSIAYGTLAVGSSNDTTTAGVNDSQTATNDGNISEDFNIRGFNIGGSWTLAGTAGVDQYVHSFCVTNCDVSPTWTPLTVSYQQLADAVAVSGNQTFDLKITVPTSTSTFTQQTAQVTVQAVAN